MEFPKEFVFEDTGERRYPKKDEFYAFFDDQGVLHGIVQSNDAEDEDDDDEDEDDEDDEDYDDDEDDDDDEGIDVEATAATHAWAENVWAGPPDTFAIYRLRP